MGHGDKSRLEFGPIIIAIAGFQGQIAHHHRCTCLSLGHHSRWGGHAPCRRFTAQFEAGDDIGQRFGTVDFRLAFAQPLDMRSDVAGRPVYLAMAQDAQGLLKLKPQNLLLNLPLAKRS